MTIETIYSERQRIMEILNKNNIREAVKQIISDILKEDLRSQMNFGTEGNIPLEAAKSICSDVNPEVLKLCDDGKRSIPYSQIGKSEYFGNTEVWKAYQQYAMAISRRADLGRKPVSFFIFLNKIRNGWKGMPLQVYKSNGNYLFGISKSGIFLCVYICPRNVGVGLFSFIKEICKYDNVVFAVTEDMASMLERLGCPKHEGTVQAKFRGKMHDKMVYGTTQKTADIGAKLLGLFGETGINADKIKKAMQENPQLMELYRKHPDIVKKIAQNDTIIDMLVKNPQIISILIDNPKLVQSIVFNPIMGILQIANKLAKRKRH